MDDKIKKIEEIIDQFAKEELGNRLSQFAILALKSIIIDTLRSKKEE